MAKKGFVGYDGKGGYHIRKGTTMPQFNNREEYEAWKARKQKELEEKVRAGRHHGAQDAETKPEEPRPSATPRQQETRPGALPSVDDLFNRSWAVYKRRVFTLIGLNILAFLFLAVSVAAFVGVGAAVAAVSGGSMKAFMIGGAVTGALAGLIFLCWGLAAVVFAVVDESLGIGAALSAGWEKIGTFIWFYSLTSFFMIGGYLLFLVPGIIFLVWFAFGQYIIADTGERGMNALLKSREYVRGHGWEVFLRLLVVWLVSVGVGMVPFIGSILSLLFMPFLSIFIYLVYEDLKALKGNVAYDRGARWGWIGTAVLGHIVLVAILAAAVALSMTGPCRMIMEQMQEKRRGESIMSPLSSCLSASVQSPHPLYRDIV